MIYGYLCEDVEQETFIENSLPLLVESSLVKCKRFEKHHEFCSQLSLPSVNREYVRRNFATAAQQGFVKYGLDFFIAAIDYDDNPPSKYAEYCKQRQEEYHHKIKRKSIVAIPNQSIEYWLWYLQHKNETPKEEQIESDTNFNREKAKRELFPIPEGKYNLSKSIRAEITNKLMQDADLKWLATRSPSFNAFVERVKEFCNHFGSRE